MEKSCDTGWFREGMTVFGVERLEEVSMTVEASVLTMSGRA